MASQNSPQKRRRRMGTIIGPPTTTTGRGRINQKNPRRGRTTGGGRMTGGGRGAAKLWGRPPGR
jgi:hypothetical protein